MSLFDKGKRKKKVTSDNEQMSALGDDPAAWPRLSEERLQQLVILKCFEYGASQDFTRIPTLFELYRHAKERLSVSERMTLLNQFAAMTEEQRGLGHMGLMVFLAVDDDPAICSTAAMTLAVLFDPQGKDTLEGPRFVVRTLVARESPSELQGQKLGGVLLLGDKRLLPILEEAWSNISDEARLGLSKAKSGFVSEASIDFWLWCLERGCSEAVFGSVVAAIAKMPVIAQVPEVFDSQRVLPAWTNSQEPIRVLRRTSFREYLRKMRPRLEALSTVESEPKVIPMIYEIWTNPDKFKGIVS